MEEGGGHVQQRLATTRSLVACGYLADLSHFSKEESVVRIAVLDDYQEVALKMADWKSLPAETRGRDIQEPYLGDRRGSRVAAVLSDCHGDA